MTQISAIYAKRSRSILNQFGQTNIGNHNHGVVVTNNSNANNNNNNNNFLNTNTGANPGIVIRDRQSVVNEVDNKGSPRLGRLRGISP
jgi:hypothetical protein